jgi:predicted metal-dependent peptidase
MNALNDDPEILKLKSLIQNTKTQWLKFFRETIITMLATNTNDMVWYSNFLTRCEYEFHFNHNFVASTYFNGNKFVIIVNPIILIYIGKDQAIAILKHEAGHIMNYHLLRGDIYKNIDQDIVNSAMDIVLNGDRNFPLIQDLPGTGDYCDSPVQCEFYQTLTDRYGIVYFEREREFEYYTNLILANNLMEGSDGNGGKRNENEKSTSNSLEGLSEKDIDDLANQLGTAIKNSDIKSDNHAFGKQKEEESSILSDEIMDKLIDITVKELITETTVNSRGHTPSEVINALMILNKRLQHQDWRKVFRKKIGSILSATKRLVNPARQHQILHDDPDFYGYGPAKQPKIGVIVDVSGSVSDEFLNAIVSEILAVQKRHSIKKVTLIQVDTAIKSIGILRANDKIFTRNGFGGTQMEPGFKSLLHQPKNKIPNIIICATDGAIENNFTEIKIPSNVHVIWLIGEKNELNFDISIYPKSQMSIIKINNQ